ncbi:RNA-binding protein 15B [Solea senegalensis]|uniref:RNA-binding protein 15B n=1 Tax=Solea senegalensis TaxID=28829 RepID=A0AAV6QNZ2_SOLSE|nr:RNA-binding protein 15B [Solea senegalensis]
MKRQAGRETSPSRAASKRMRERERESVRREELPPPPPLALLLAESRGYHRRSRSREREKPRLREERAAAALELHHRHELSLLGRPPLRSTAATAAATAAAAVAELPAARPGTLEYKTLLISNLGSQVSDEDVEDALFHDFKKFGDVSVKLSHTPELGRIAYVNFRHPEDAKEARHAKSSRLVLVVEDLKPEDDQRATKLRRGFDKEEEEEEEEEEDEEEEEEEEERRSGKYSDLTPGHSGESVPCSGAPQLEPATLQTQVPSSSSNMVSERITVRVTHMF